MFKNNSFQTRKFYGLKIIFKEQDAVGFVVKSTEARFTPSQEDIFRVHLCPVTQILPVKVDKLLSHFIFP